MNEQRLIYSQPNTMLILAGLVLVGSTACILLLQQGRVDLMQYVYPFFAMFIGGWLYAIRTDLYVGFVWWIWVLTPFIRRVVDYNLGYFTSISLVMLTPFLVTLFCFFTLVRNGNRLLDRPHFPYLLAIVGITYGFLVGFVKVGAEAAVFDLLQWMCPVLFGFHLVLTWSEYPNYRRVILKTFSGIVFVLGVYGIAQYYTGPAWDMFWLTESGMTSSMGKAEPTRFRIFATLNSAGTLGLYLMAGLILMFDWKGLFPRLASVPGYVAFLLTLVRSAWIGWLLALTYMVYRLTGAQKARLVSILVITGIVSMPLIVSPAVFGRIQGRVATFESLSEDNSLKARFGLYREASKRVATEPLGSGLGNFGKAAKMTTGESRVFDSGFLAIALSLGWLGCSLYVLGLGFLVKHSLGASIGEDDHFSVVSAGIGCSLIVILFTSNVAIGPPGMLFWFFLSMPSAAKVYRAYNPTFVP